MDEFEIKVRTFWRIINSRDLLKNQARSVSNLNVKRILRSKFPVIDSELHKFVTFARRLILPVTRQRMQERAMMIASTNDITDVNGSNGYTDRFIRRNNIHRSVRLHGCGGSALPRNHEERSEISSIASAYPLLTIYNMDESGLFYRLRPRMSYLSLEEIHATVWGTELQRHKNRISIVLYVNGDGSHTASVWYIGHPADPKFFGIVALVFWKGTIVTRKMRGLTVTSSHIG